jgi:hypothetical protein
MAGDVGHIINAAATAREGAAIINPNSLKIPIAKRYLEPTNELNAISDTAASGLWVDRFDDTTYYTT